MSLRVDLIADEERRSGNVVSLKSFTRIGVFVVPAIIVLLVVVQALNSFIASSELRLLESRWESAEAKQKHALQLVGRVNFNQQTVNELNAWKATRLAWHKQLLALMESTPPSIQLTTLVTSLEKTSAPPSPPVRHFSMVADAKTSGARAMRQVESFESRVESHHSVTGVINTIDIENYAADPASRSGEFDRVFQLVCDYRELTGPQ
jgi:hypothetical protein